jgi:hypothetical protein
MPYSIKAKDICSLIQSQLGRFLETNPDEKYAKNLLNLMELLKPSFESRMPRGYYLKNKQALTDCFKALNLTEGSSSFFEMDSSSSFELGIIYWGALQLLNSQYCEQSQDLLAALSLEPVLKLRLLRAPQFLFAQLENFYKAQIDTSRKEIQERVKAIRDSWDCVIWQSAENMILAWENQVSESSSQAIEIDFPDFDVRLNVVFAEPSEEWLPNTIYLYQKEGFSLFSILSFFGQKISDQGILIGIPFEENAEFIQKVRSQDKFASIQLNTKELELLQGLSIDDKKNYTQTFNEIHYTFLMLDFKIQLINDFLHQITTAIPFPEKLKEPLLGLNQQFIFLQNIFQLQSAKIEKLKEVGEERSLVLKSNIDVLYQNYGQKIQTLKHRFALFEKKRTDTLGLIAYPTYTLCASDYALTAKDFKLLGIALLLASLSISAFPTLFLHASLFAAGHLFLFDCALLGSFIAFGIAAYISVDFGLKYFSSLHHHDETRSLTRQELLHPQTTLSL